MNLYRSAGQEQDGDMIVMNLSNLQCHDITSESLSQLQSEYTPENPGKEIQKNVKVEEPVLEYHLGDDSDVIFVDVPTEILTVNDSTEDLFQNINDSNGLSDSGILGESLISVQTQPERQVNELRLWLKFNQTYSKAICLIACALCHLFISGESN